MTADRVIAQKAIYCYTFDRFGHINNQKGTLFVNCDCYAPLFYNFFLNE